MDINGESSSSSSPGFKLFGKTIVASEKDGQDQDDHSSITIADHEEESSENNTTKTKTKTTTTSTTTKRGPGHLLLACPRCKSRETKFCYFNNYNVNQPRHFCKACHRYWTAGGALRNVPAGAGRRKNRALPPQGSSSSSGVAGGEEEG